MFSTLRTAMIAGLVGLMSLSAMPAAKADGIYLGFGDHRSDARFGVYIGDNHGPRYHRNWRAERRCSPHRALNKAARMGIHRARVNYVTHRRIGVIGRKHGYRVAITFARTPRCPIIR